MKNYLSVKEQNNLGDLLKYEATYLYSREEVRIAEDLVLTLGTVIGRVSDIDEYHALLPVAEDGRQIAYGVLAQDVCARDENTKAVIITRHAILADHAVIWPDIITPEQKKIAIAQLEARGILIRKGV